MCQSPLGLWQPPKAGSIHRISDSWGMNVAPGSAFLTSPQRCSGHSLRNIILVWHYQIFFFLQSFLIIITIIIIILAFSKHVWHKQSSFTLKKPDSSRKYLQKKWINTGKLFIFSMKLLQHPRTDIEKSLASPYWSCSSLEGDEMGLQRLPLGQGYCWTLPSWEWPDNAWSPAGPRLSWFFSLLGWYGS